MVGTHWGQWRKLLALGSLLLAGSLAQAQLSGAIFTSTVDGTTVNGNIYDAKEDVYLNGGPQNKNGSLLPDGVYFFQVTNPNGAVLLSTTNAMDRLEKVTGGRFAGRCDAAGNLLPDPVSPHPNGTYNPANGSLPVQLFPYDDTPNNGGEYKAWLIVRTFDGDSKVYSTPADDGVHINFLDRWAKTDNFKIKITGTPPQGMLSGTKFFDLNMDGIKDPNEPPIAGVVIEITLGNNAPVYVTTDANGFWQYGPVDGGTDYEVCEELPGDDPNNDPDDPPSDLYDSSASKKWIQTAPGTANDDESVRCYSGTVNGDQGGLDFGNTEITNINGEKYYDSNINGNLDNTENGISGWKIDYTITYPDGTIDNETVTTDASGKFSIPNIPIGSTYSFSEELGGSNWKQTGPSGNVYSGSIDVNPGPYDVTYNQPDVNGLNFGNILQASLKGTKFNDTNMNGTKDGSESGVQGVTINITGTKPDGTTYSDSTTTDASGNYSFGPYPDGTTYDITEVVPTGWIQTTPVHITGTITATGPITASSTLDDVTGLNIGNVKVFNISGLKFYDKNMNGSKDGGEPTIAGVTISITGTKPDGTAISTSTTTDANGAFSFGPYPDGTTFSLHETSLGSNWIETTTDPITGSLSGADSTGNNFGNILTGKIAGTKFIDSNMNGTQDGTEVGMSGVTINISGTKPNGATFTDSTTTGANGAFSFGPYPDGTTFSITEVVPTGYIQTTATPATGTISSSGTITISSTIPDTKVGVGNIAVFKIKGIKFFDHNMNGVQDANDQTLQGFTINISGTKPNGNTFTDSTVTDANGAFCFGPYPNGTTFSITETVPTGWQQTTASPITGTLNGADSTGSKIGNISLFSLSGLKWYDSNANGVKEGTEPTIKGFKIVITWTKPNATTGTTTVYTDASGNWTAGPYPYGTTYKVTEVAPAGNWHESYPAAPGYYTGTLTSNTSGLAFGNFLTGGGNGLTPGYWSNNNGYNSANAIGWTTVMNKLNTSNLRNLNGTIQTWPATANGYKAYQTWSGAGTNASNMATQLSVHLSAFELNVMSGKIPGSTLIYAPGSTSANALGYATANALIAEAIAELGAHGLTVQASATRTYQEALKNAFANANMQVGSSTVLPPVTIIVPSPY